jgi:hypothetical protein
MIQTNTTTEADATGKLYSNYGDGPAFTAGGGNNPIHPPPVSPYQ